MLERRRYVRFPLIAKVVFTLEGSPSLEHTCLSANIGGGGIRLCLERPLAVGQKLKLSFTLPTENTPISAEGTVVWTKEKEMWAGIKFTRIEKGDKAHIISYIKEYLRIELP